MRCWHRFCTMVYIYQPHACTFISFRTIIRGNLRRHVFYWDAFVVVMIRLMRIPLTASCEIGWISICICGYREVFAILSILFSQFNPWISFSYIPSKAYNTANAFHLECKSSRLKKKPRIDVWYIVWKTESCLELDYSTHIYSEPDYEILAITGHLPFLRESDR